MQISLMGPDGVGETIGWIHCSQETPTPDRIVLCSHAALFPHISVNTQKKGLVMPGYITECYNRR